MSLIALELEDNRIYAAVGRISGKRVQIQNLFSFEISGSDEEVATQLKEQMANRRITRGDAIIVVGRGNAEVRCVDVPPAPSNELPEIVRFVARNEFASLNDNWLLDFARLSGDDASTGQVLAAGVSPEMSNQVKAIAEHAGLKLKHIVLRPFAAVDFVQDRLQDNSVQLLVDRNGDQVDLTIVDGRKVVATRTIRLAPGSDLAEKLIPEVRRTITSSARALAGRQLNQVMLFGTGEDAVEVADRIQSRLECDVQVVDPLKQSGVSNKIDCDEPTRYVALMGAIQNRAGREGPILDFLNPKKNETSGGNYSKYLMFGGLAMAGLLMLAIFGWWKLGTQKQDIDDLQSKLDVLQDRNSGNDDVPSVKTILAEVDQIDQWYLRSINWHEQLLDYSKLALTADDTIVDTFTATGPSSRTEGSIDIKARASSLPKEKELIDSLSKRYAVRPERTDDLQDDKDYPVASALDLKFGDGGKTLKVVDDYARELFIKEATARAEAAKKNQLKQSSDVDPTDQEKLIGKTSQDETGRP